MRDSVLSALGVELGKHENWELAGAKTATTRATDLWQQALKDYEQPATDPAIRDELDAFIAKRKT